MKVCLFVDQRGKMSESFDQPAAFERPKKKKLNVGFTIKCFKLTLCCICVFFQSGALFDRVFNTYKLMHTNQTVDFVERKVNTARGIYTEMTEYIK